RHSGRARRRAAAALAPRQLNAGLHTSMVARVTRVLPPNDALVRNAGVAATELIREAIIEGRLEPGRRLKEEELARELGISRTPVREALLMLQAEDLVVATPNRGATVRVHDAKDLQDLYELRALLEGFATRRAAERIAKAERALPPQRCDRQLVKALADADADRAELIMKEHLFEARDMLVAHVRKIQAGQL